MTDAEHIALNGLITALVIFLGKLVEYFVQRTRQIKIANDLEEAKLLATRSAERLESVDKKIDAVDEKADDAKLAARAAVTVAASTGKTMTNAIAENTDKTEEIRKAVNGQRDALIAENEALKKRLSDLTK